MVVENETLNLKQIDAILIFHPKEIAVYLPTPVAAKS